MTESLEQIAADAKSLLEAADRMEAAGIPTSEIAYVTHVDRTLAYINRGDTYDLTIGREANGPLIVTSWGGWIESLQVEHCRENDLIQCGYCGEYTPHDPDDDWRDVTCESCGRNVATGEE